MNKERVLKKVVSDLFTEIFQIGVKMGRTIDLKDEKKDKALRETVGFLNEGYLNQKKREFTKRLKESGILPMR